MEDTTCPKSFAGTRTAHSGVIGSRYSRLELRCSSGEPLRRRVARDVREGALAVTYSARTFIVGPDDTLYRLAGTKFAAMLDHPENHRLPRFAGQRVRMVEAIVELRDRAAAGSGLARQQGVE
jgi:hypothetical protein